MKANLLNLIFISSFSVFIISVKFLIAVLAFLLIKFIIPYINFLMSSNFLYYCHFN